jgi:2-hydroxychromene-2-carboxylate isomerase
MRHINWQARRLGVPYKLPRAFPFVPIKALRLAVSLGPDRHTVETIFRCIWVDGMLPQDEDGWKGITEALGVDDADARIERPEVKDELIANGKRATDLGVFGLPTYVLDGVLFWGVDETDFLLDVLADPTILEDPEMARVATAPSAIPPPKPA